MKRWIQPLFYVLGSLGWMFEFVESWGDYPIAVAVPFFFACLCARWAAKEIDQEVHRWRL